MSRKPRWKEAQELAARYREYGVQYCYNNRNRNVYLSLLDAPTCVPNVEGCQLTGYLIIYGGVVESRNIDACIEKLISSYKKAVVFSPAHREKPQVAPVAIQANPNIFIL